MWVFFKLIEVHFLVSKLYIMFTSVQMSTFWAGLMLILYHPCCIVILLQHWRVIHPLSVEWISERDPWVFGKIIRYLFEMTWKWNCKNFSFSNISLKGSHVFSDQYVNAKWRCNYCKNFKTELRLNIKWFMQLQSTTRIYASVIQPKHKDMPSNI